EYCVRLAIWPKSPPTDRRPHARGKPVNQLGKGPSPLAAKQTRQIVQSIVDQRKSGPDRRQNAANKAFNVNDIGLERMARAAVILADAKSKLRKGRTL